MESDPIDSIDSIDSEKRGLSQFYASRLVASAFQRGFSLISAIFLLVVIAALGTFAVTISTTQHMGAAQDVMGARAYQAARAGIEWGAYRLLITGARPGKRIRIRR